MKVTKGRNLTIFFDQRGGIKMPKTKFQEIIFTIMMVVVMVYAMVVYNISLDKNGLSNEVFILAFGELLIMGVIGFIFEILIAGPLAKKLAFRIVTPGKDKPIFLILTISAMTVCVMCPMMSFVATLLFKGFDVEFIAKWIQTTAINFPMAFCWQIFFAGPFVRLLFGKIFKEEN